MHVKDAIATKQNVTLWAKSRCRRSRYKRIQLYRTDLHKVSGPIRIKLKKLLSRQIVYFYFFVFRLSNKMPSRTPMAKVHGRCDLQVFLMLLSFHHFCGFKRMQTFHPIQT